ncbi:Beta-galactosidase/beta-glucuronidase [Paenibacillus sp. UNCCL117]|uniref:glycoside hydrolase family 2 protein n=1 Tax=unclassified Paenibacillus TaxID=185978 RepID=UPI00088514B5|nr:MULTISPECIES: glycoside hydrolase family 2 TIM barrel-domain containing protein [unclassified Paenibacillus]SDE07555.1 Beta-galactosidase/beta-glucuronidase [Paenibacillus sp. cl123]SFW59149.1 Beta-galactosidase/beta-glucuronidase [Paenibacillus sp. UNCCL117]
MTQQRLNEGWEHYKGSLGGPWEVWRADKLQNHYNVPWEPVTLPHTYNGLDVMDPDGKYYQGQGWYRTRLDIHNPYPKGRTLLHFEGAGQRTDVYVYTEKVGSHLGGYDEFTVDITEAAERARQIERYAGRVPVAVACDNSRELETIPSDASDFNLYGGIYRYLNLKYVPQVSLARVHVETDVHGLSQGSGGAAADGLGQTAAAGSNLEKQAVERTGPEAGDAADAEAVNGESGAGSRRCLVRVKASLYNPDAVRGQVKLTIQLKDSEGRRIGSAEKTCEIWDDQQEIAALVIEQPRLWSTDVPYLYTCAVTLQAEDSEMETVERFGVRTFEFVKQGPFKLNGERLLLRGTHRHEDYAAVGAAMTEEQIREEMQLIKDMGANFIRLGHYQQSRIVLDLCDELGILVWEEIPWCRGGLGGPEYRQQCVDMLTAMIEQHYNHPSVILWGLGNENDWECDFDHFDQEEIRVFMKELHDLSHKLDPSRLTAIRRCEFCKDIIDVYSPSIWAGWYRGIYTDYESSCRTAFENVDSFFHMEWGADNLATRHVEKTFTGFEFIRSSGADTDERDGDYLLTGGEPRVSRDGDWSETYFCEMIDWYLKSQERMDWLTGAAQWAFKDFATPVRPDSPIPYLNMKGIVERDLTPKEAFYVFQSYWTSKPMVRIYGHSMPVRWGAPDERKQIRVYSNADEVELFLNGESLGVRRRDSQNFPAAGLRWETVLPAGENQVRAVAVKDGVTVSDELSFVYQTESWGEPAELRIKAEPQADGRVYVEVQAVDAQGVFCPDAAQFVRFGLAGDGRLLDNLGTIRGSRLVQLASGRAGIYVDPHGGLPAGITVRDFVTAGGPAASLTSGRPSESAPEGPAGPARVSVVSAACEGMATAWITVSSN